MAELATLLERTVLWLCGETVRVEIAVVPSNVAGYLSWQDGYLITVHPRATDWLRVVLHEVGHILCGHLQLRRPLSTDTIARHMGWLAEHKAANSLPADLLEREKEADAVANELTKRLASLMGRETVTDEQGVTHIAGLGYDILHAE